MYIKPVAEFIMGCDHLIESNRDQVYYFSLFPEVKIQFLKLNVKSKDNSLEFTNSSDESLLDILFLVDRQTGQLTNPKRVYTPPQSIIMITMGTNIK